VQTRCELLFVWNADEGEAGPTGAKRMPHMWANQPPHLSPQIAAHHHAEQGCRAGPMQVIDQPCVAPAFPYRYVSAYYSGASSRCAAHHGPTGGTAASFHSIPCHGANLGFHFANQSIPSSPLKEPFARSLVIIARFPSPPSPFFSHFLAVSAVIPSLCHSFGTTNTRYRIPVVWRQLQRSFLCTLLESARKSQQLD
jgi:hypothetical protein